TGGGTSRLHLIVTNGALIPPGIRPADLLLPNPEVRPQTGRFDEHRGIKYPTIHLGSDYMAQGNDVLVPPSPEAILVAAVYLKRGLFEAVAIDMSAEVQMYLVNLSAGDHLGLYIICYAHLRNGSNDEAIREALANNGHVQTMGYI